MLQLKIKPKIPSLSISTENEILQNYNVNNILHRDKFNGVCFDFVNEKAFDNEFYIYDCDSFYYNILEDCDNIEIENMQENDIVVYFRENRPVHFAIIKNPDYNDYKNTIIISKWGKLGVYESSIEDVPYRYGNFIRVFRKQ